MTFKNRLLQEETYGQPGGFDNHMKKNWGKYATGAGLGALGMAASHILGGNEGGALDEFKDAHEQGNLWNTVMDKGQSGLEAMKGGGGDDNNMADFAKKGSPFSNQTSNDYNDSGDSKITNLPNFKPKFDKLNGIVDSADSSDSAAPTTTQSAPTPTTADLKAAALPYAGAPEGSRMPFFGEDMPSHLKSTFFGNADPSVTPEDIEAQRQQMISDNYDKQYGAFTKSNDAAQAALKEFKQDSGDMTPEKIKEMNTILTGLKTAPEFTANNTAGMGRNAESVLEKTLTGNLDNSMTWAKNNGYPFMLNGNIRDDLAAFSAMQNKGGIPPQLMPIYREVMRAAQG